MMAKKMACSIYHICAYMCFVIVSRSVNMIFCIVIVYSLCINIAQKILYLSSTWYDHPILLLFTMEYVTIDLFCTYFVWYFLVCVALPFLRCANLWIRKVHLLLPVIPQRICLMSTIISATSIVFDICDRTLFSALSHRQIDL